MDWVSLIVPVVLVVAIGVIRFWLHPGRRLMAQVPVWVWPVLFPALVVGVQYLRYPDNPTWVYALGGGGGFVAGLLMWVRAGRRVGDADIDTAAPPSGRAEPGAAPDRRGM